MTEIEVM